jgi:P4 family phage/plasmid primase-like protien
LALQILGLREINNKVTHSFFEKRWQVESVRELFAKADAIIEDIPEDERWNLYFTVHDCVGIKPRDFLKQDVIPFDIDDVPLEHAKRVAELACEAIGVNFSQTAISYSGHGLQLFVQLEEPIEDPRFFTENRELYKSILQKINALLRENELPGKPDPAVFSAARLMRMPNTWNRKPAKGKDVFAHVLQPTLELQGFSLAKAAGIYLLPASETVDRRAWERYPEPDTDGILAGCEFIKWASTNQKDVSEPQWHALIGTVSFMPNGESLVHEFSKEHPNYSEAETSLKYQYAKKNTGPRKCESVCGVWDGCKACPYYGKITTPLQIQGEDFVQSESTGFYNIFVSARGTEKREPDFEGLIKHFRKTKGPFFATTAGAFYYYSKADKYWVPMSDVELQSFAYNKMDPRPRSSITTEFVRTIMSISARDPNWFSAASKRKLNLQNGVFDMVDGTISEHSPEFGFRSILPYAYKEGEVCPKFDKFLQDVSCGDPDIVRLLWEYMGYAISGDDYWVHKALILYGTGSNGKSTFNKVLKALVGKGYYSSLNLNAIQNEQKRALLEGKLFNLGDENNAGSLLDSDTFKSLVSGDEYDVKRIYLEPYTLTNTTKMIFNCNSLPVTRDKSHGFYRRLLFVVFNARFDDDAPTTDKRIEHKLYTELPGILIKAAKAYKDLLARGHFLVPKSSEELFDEYVDVNDDFQGWIDERVEFVASGEESTDGLYNDYIAWNVRNNNKYPDAKLHFSRKLGALPGVTKSQFWNGELRGKRGYTGLKLRTDF